MNAIDILIILLILVVIHRGLKVGLVHVMFSTGGFISGLLLGNVVAKNLAVSFSNPIAKLLIVIMSEVFFTALFYYFGNVIGIYLTKKAKKLRLGVINDILGVSLEIFLAFIVIWIVAAGLTNVRSYNIGRDIRQSAIINRLNEILPSPPPNIFAELEKVISPNSSPKIFVGQEPEHPFITPSSTLNTAAILKNADSVVRVGGTGCGGIVEGTGFVVADDLVLTNAHVVAGILYPEVASSNQSFDATVVWFDPLVDVAFLRVEGLRKEPLELVNQDLLSSDPVAALGYPGGGPLKAAEGVVLDKMTAQGQDIYNSHIVYREIYAIQADINPGDSGGPLLNRDGDVAGVVFAKSISQPVIGYALAIGQIQPAITQAEAQEQPVSTGTCAAS